MSNSFELCPTHFSRGAKKFPRGQSPLRPHTYGPECWEPLRYHVTYIHIVILLKCLHEKGHYAVD